MSAHHESSEFDDEVLAPNNGMQLTALRAAADAEAVMPMEMKRC